MHELYFPYVSQESAAVTTDRMQADANQDLRLWIVVGPRISHPFHKQGSGKDHESR